MNAAAANGKQNKFGTSDNFKNNAYMASHYNNSGNFDQRTDGFARKNANNKSPIVNHQFSTMNGMLRSEGGMNDDGIEDEEEQIEEDICDNGESPLINA